MRKQLQDLARQNKRMAEEFQVLEAHVATAVPMMPTNCRPRSKKLGRKKQQVAAAIIPETVILPTLPKKPKRSQSAYLFFCMDHRPKIKEIHPNLTGVEIMGKLGEAWRDLAESNKTKYFAMAKTDSARFAKESAIYKAKYNKEIAEYEEAKKKAKKQIRKNNKLLSAMTSVSLPELPPGPKRAQSAYLYFCADRRPSIKQAHPDMKGTDIMTKLGDLWRELPDSAKIPFQEEAEKDKNRYDRENAIYQRENKEIIAKYKEAKKASKKQLKNQVIPKSLLPELPKPPKRAQSAYLFFCQERRVMIKDQFPEMKGTEIVTKLGQQWQTLNESQKTRYVAEAKKDKERFERENAQYKRDHADEITRYNDTKRNLKKQTKYGAFVTSEFVQQHIAGGAKKMKKEKRGPKRAQSAYLFFCKARRPVLKQQDPTLTSPEVMTKLGLFWRHMSKSEKAPFERLAENDRLRYEQECVMFHQTHHTESSGKRQKTDKKVPSSSYNLQF